MHIGLITYNTGHLKTWQLIQRFLVQGRRVTVFAFPFKVRPPKEDAQARFQDRPFQLTDIDLAAFCRQHGIRWVNAGGWADEYADVLGLPGHPDTPDVLITAIGKIIPASFIAGRTILNTHPGVLPANRGLDAFKWGILHRYPFGVTLHAIDEVIDRGMILRMVRTPVLPTDTLADVCQRSYEVELDLLAHCELFLPHLSEANYVGDDHPLSRRLIPIEDDQSLERTFLENRDLFVKLSTDDEPF